MKLEDLEKFIKFMDEHNLLELEIEEEGKRIKLKKMGQELPLVVSRESNVNPTPVEVSKEEKKVDEELIEIKAPMVGTFYRAPSPGAKPYVEVGEDIKPGDILCIIEAMKLMNEIKAEVSGKIEKILVENADPVEFGQTLFLVRPT